MMTKVAVTNRSNGEQGREGNPDGNGMGKSPFFNFSMHSTGLFDEFRGEREEANEQRQLVTAFWHLRLSDHIGSSLKGHHSL